MDGDGGVTVLPDVKEPDEKYMYNPKFPIPKGCHTKIDAALTVGGNFKKFLGLCAPNRVFQ